jgi:hypothetical protein
MFSPLPGRACRRCYSHTSAFLPSQSHRCPALTASRKVAYPIHRADLAPVLAAIVSVAVHYTQRGFGLFMTAWLLPRGVFEIRRF